MSEKIKYLEHPVTAEEKKKWRDKGFKIVDIQFKPTKGDAETEQEESKAE